MNKKRIEGQKQRIYRKKQKNYYKNMRYRNDMQVIRITDKTWKDRQKIKKKKQQKDRNRKHRKQKKCHIRKKIIENI